MPALNSAGYADAQFSYDHFRRAVEKRWFDTQGMPVNWVGLVYDRQGWNTQITVYGADGSIQLVENNMYDEFGSWVQRFYTDGKGQPCMTEFGFATARAVRDALGNVTDLWLYDETGNPCDSIYHQVYTYSVTGKTVTEESYDGNGQFIQREGHTYDSYDRLVETRYYDEDGSCTGWRVYTYSPWGDRIESFYYDTDEVQAGFVYEGFITKS